MLMGKMGKIDVTAVKKNPNTYEEEAPPSTGMLFAMAARERGRRVKRGCKAGPGQQFSCFSGYGYEAVPMTQ